MNREPMTVDEALKLLEAVVADFGEDHVYQRHSLAEGGATCRHIHNGEPDCLVGHVLIRSGRFTAEELSDIQTVRLAAFTYPGRLVDEATHVLVAAQSTQDAGCTWGVALERARRVAQRLASES